MKEPREDDERLSALLENGVEVRQREELLVHLSEADDDYEVFANTASVLRALEEEDARARGPVAPPSMRRRAWPATRTLVAVAGMVVLLLAAGLLFRGRGESVAGDPVRLAMSLDVGRANRSPWIPQGTRGFEVPTAKRPRAVYAGARLVDLAVAVQMRDTAQIHDRATALQSALDARTNPDALLSRISANADAPIDSLNALLREATDEYAARLDREALEVGAWIEAARLAALAEDTAFFAARTTGGMLRRAARLARGNAAAEQAVAEVDAASLRNGADWDLLAERLETMLARLAQMGAPSPST